MRTLKQLVLAAGVASAVSAQAATGTWTCEFSEHSESGMINNVVFKSNPVEDQREGPKKAAKAALVFSANDKEVTFLTSYGNRFKTAGPKPTERKDVWAYEGANDYEPTTNDPSLGSTDYVVMTPDGNKAIAMWLHTGYFLNSNSAPGKRIVDYISETYTGECKPL